MDNPIVETYRGIHIKKYPMVQIRVSVWQMKKIIDAKLDFGLSEKEAVSRLNLFCECSQSVQIVRYGKSNGAG